jgi:hypothetical protein
MVTTRSGSKSSKIKLPLVGSVSYLAAAAGVAVIYYLWSGSGGLGFSKAGPNNWGHTQSAA